LAKKVTLQSSMDLKDAIIEAMLDRKAQDILLDLRDINESVADFFIVCHGESTTQVGGIAENVYHEVKDKTAQFPNSTEGKKSAQWVIVDYGDVVAHIFHKDVRDFYALEDLWSDAVQQKFALPEILPPGIKVAKKTAAKSDDKPEAKALAKKAIAKKAVAKITVAKTTAKKVEAEAPKEEVDPKPKSTKSII
jgi:ribosome-associated protein